MSQYYESLFPRSNDYTVHVKPENGEKTGLITGIGHQFQPKAFNYESEVESFAQWDYEGKAEVTVTVINPEIKLQNVIIRPRKNGIYPAIDPVLRTVSFSIDSRNVNHRILSVEIDGMTRPLFLFTNPYQTDVPDPDDSGVYCVPGSQSDGDVITNENFNELANKYHTLYFKKGIYNITTCHVVCDNLTLYLQEGAMIRMFREDGYGFYHKEGMPTGFRFTGKNIKVYGRGIIDCKWSTDRFSRPLYAHGWTMDFNKCTGVYVEGLLFNHSMGFCLVASASRDVVFRLIKSAGCQDMTSNDGILIDGTVNALVEQCFVNNHDDSLDCKTHVNVGGPTDSVLFRDCVVWNRGGMALATAWENWFDIKNVTFRNISVIHHENYGNATLAICVGSRGHVENILFEDIDVEDTPFGGIAIVVEQHPWCLWGSDTAAKCLGVKREELPAGPNENWSYVGNIHFKNVTIKHREGFDHEFYPRPKVPGNGNGHGGKGYKLHLPMPEFSSGKTEVTKPHLSGNIIFENVKIETYRDHTSFPRFGRGEDHAAGRPIMEHYLSDLTTDYWFLWEGTNPFIWEFVPGTEPEDVYSPMPEPEEQKKRIEFWESKVKFIYPDEWKQDYSLLQ